MKKIKKQWVLTSPQNLNAKLTLSEKQEISDYFQPLVDEFKSKNIVENPDKSNNYLIDIYTKWYRDYLYFCEKYKSEHPNRIADDFELKYVRLKCTGLNKFEYSYLRFNEQWYLQAENLTKEDCWKLIKSNPNFQL